MNCLHSCKIYYQNSIGYNLYKYKKFSLGKNLSLYSPMEVWLTMAQVALVYNKLEWPKYCSYRLFLILKEMRGFESPSRRFRKLFHLLLDVWKSNFHWDTMSLCMYFLLRSQKDILGKDANVKRLLESLSITKWKYHFSLLGQFQNLIWLLVLLWKNSLNSWEMVAKWIWYGWDDESKIFFIACRKSIMMIIH